jgi:type IV secretory pathway VirJ component
MAILYSGDGGWQATDKGLARILAENGIPVIGLNTLRYFWTRRTPEEASKDFARVLAHYQSAWKKDRVIVIGYSFGADVLPFLLTRSPKPLQSHIEMLALLAPTKSVDFEFHVKQWFSEHSPQTSRPVLPELEKLSDMKIVSYCGALDSEALCREMPGSIKRVLVPRAGHRFDNLYAIVARDILKESGKSTR